MTTDEEIDPADPSNPIPSEAIPDDAGPPGSWAPLNLRGPSAANIGRPLESRTTRRSADPLIRPREGPVGPGVGTGSPEGELLEPDLPLRPEGLPATPPPAYTREPRQVHATSSPRRPRPISPPNRDFAELIRDFARSIEDFDTSIRDAHRRIEQRLGTLQERAAELSAAANTRQGGHLGPNVSTPSEGLRLVPLRPTSVYMVNTPRGVGSTAASTRDSNDLTVHLERALIAVLRNHEQSLSEFQRTATITDQMLRDAERTLRYM
jgi:hypothetical protein